MGRRLRPFVAGFAVASVLAASCSETRKASFDGTSDRLSVERVTGTWRANGAISWRLTLCDTAERSFCSTDRCKAEYDHPCHEIRVDGPTETLEYEDGSGMACDCYGCECFHVRAGFALRGSIATEHGVMAVEGTGALVSIVGAEPRNVSLELRAGVATYSLSLDGDLLVVDAFAPAGEQDSGSERDAFTPAVPRVDDAGERDGGTISAGGVPEASADADAGGAPIVLPGKVTFYRELDRGDVCDRQSASSPSRN